MNISSFSILLLYCGLRRLVNHSRFFQNLSGRRSYSSSPFIHEDSAALLENDDDDASTIPKPSSRGQILANDTNGNPSEIDHSYPRISEEVFGIRETARLGFAFGVLWVKLCLSLRTLPLADGCCLQFFVRMD